MNIWQTKGYPSSSQSSPSCPFPPNNAGTLNQKISPGPGAAFGGSQSYSLIFETVLMFCIAVIGAGGYVLSKFCLLVI